VQHNIYKPAKHSGFTIVELAIVLVVIGIILGMAVKGKSLVDAARFKAEINKINKLQTALHIWLATHPDLTAGLAPSGQWQGPSLDMKFLYDAGILSEGELDCGYGWESPSYGSYKWQAIACQDNVLLYGEKLWSYASFRAGYKDFCASLSTDDDEIGRLDTLFIPPALQCGIETILDDQNVINGSARRLSGGASNLTNYTDDEYADCRALSMEPADTGMMFKLW
jgi:prepilin-type N-terminal cleavage/methylation domain-containing protein